MAAVAQAQQVVAANAQSSLACVKSLLKLAVFQVCGLRGLFDEDAFVKRPLAGLTNMLDLKADYSPETRTVCEWIELGVNNALEKRCLKSMVFCISAANDSPVPEVLEQYVFDFAFTADGSGATMELSAKTGNQTKTLAEAEAATLGGLKKQACSLLRNLIASIATLSEVPDDRMLSIQLVYNDDADVDYEPPGFVAADPEALGGFARAPTLINVGGVRSDHHRVSVKVRSVLDNAEEAAAAEQAPLRDDCLRSVAGGVFASQGQVTQSDARVAQPLRAAPRPAADGAEGYDSDETRDDEPGTGKAAAKEDVDIQPVSAMDHSVDFAPHAAVATPVPLSAIAQLAASMHAGEKLDALYVASRLPSLSMADIEVSLAALAAQGVLTHLAREDRFVRSGPGAAAPAAAPATAAPTRRGTRARKADAPVMDLSHQLARLHAAGPAPPARGSKRAAAAAPPAEAPASLAAPEEQSHAAKRTRKMSATQAIRQRKPAAGALTPPPATTGADDIFSAALL